MRLDVESISYLRNRKSHCVKHSLLHSSFIKVLHTTYNLGCQRPLRLFDLMRCFSISNCSTKFLYEIEEFYIISSLFLRKLLKVWSSYDTRGVMLKNLFSALTNNIDMILRIRYYLRYS